MMYDLTDKYGFKDAWIETRNNGNYDDFSEWSKLYSSSYWGVWDSVEKFYYRSGGGIEITAEDFEYYVAENEKGERLSDHNGAVCNFIFAKSADFKDDTRKLSKSKAGFFSRIFSMIKWICKDLIFVLGDNFDEFLSLIGLKK